MHKKAGQVNTKLGLQHRATNSTIGHPYTEPQDIYQSLLPKYVDKYNI
jgi:hypothetical protein